MSKVSILIPTYKPTASFLKEAIGSLLAQTEQDFEVIICDEPTEVDTESIVKHYLQDKRFSFYRNPKRLGIGGNWNACLAKAKSPYIQYLFQDDLWEPRYLASALDVMEHNPSVGIVSLNHEYLCDEGIETEESYRDLENYKEEHLQEGLQKGKQFLSDWLKTELHPNVVGEPSFVMLRKSIVDRVGTFDEAMHQFLDVEYWLRMLAVSDVYYLPENYGAFRVHGDAASANNHQTGKGIFDRFACFQSLIKKLKGDPLQKEVVAARNKSLDGMARKFFQRLKNRKGITTAGSGSFRTFALLHPLTVLAACVRVLVHKERDT